MYVCTYVHACSMYLIVLLFDIRMYDNEDW